MWHLPVLFWIDQCFLSFGKGTSICTFVGSFVCQQKSWTQILVVLVQKVVGIDYNVGNIFDAFFNVKIINLQLKSATTQFYM